MDITYLLRVLTRRKKFLFTGLIIGLLGGLIFSLFSSREYLSTVPGKSFSIIAISAFTMFFLSMLFIIILEFLDSSLRTPSIFKKQTQINLLSEIGEFNLIQKSIPDYFRFSRTDIRDNSVAPFVENIRKLRYEIEHSGKQTILFTSAKSQEGKTTVMEALAQAFVLLNKRILIIDSNFNNNELTRIFSAKPALNDFQYRINDENEEFRNIISSIADSKVDVIGCGEGSFTPLEILPPNNLLTQLNDLKTHYDFIFLEGASLNTYVDSKELSDFVDGIIVVFSAENSIGETDRESLNFLKRKGNKLIGAVLNKIDPQNEGN